VSLVQLKTGVLILTIWARVLNQIALTTWGSWGMGSRDEGGLVENESCLYGRATKYKMPRKTLALG
jgi:hypothetical protein